MIEVYTGKAVSIYTWTVRKHACRLEAKGMRHSSGRSIRAFVKRELGLKRNASQQEIEEAIDARIDEIVRGYREGL